MVEFKLFMSKYFEYRDLSVRQKMKADGLCHYFQNESVASDFAAWVNQQRIGSTVSVRHKRISGLKFISHFCVTLSETQLNAFSKSGKEEKSSLAELSNETNEPNTLELELFLVEKPNKENQKILLTILDYLENDEFMELMLQGSVFTRLVLNGYLNKRNLEVMKPKRIKVICEKLASDNDLSLICELILNQKDDIARMLISDVMNVEMLSKFLKKANDETYKNSFIAFFYICQSELQINMFHAVPDLCLEFIPDGWFQGHEQTELAKDIFSKYFKDKKELNPLLLAFKQFMELDEKEEKEVYSKHEIKNGKSESFKLQRTHSNKKLIRTIFENGLASYIDLHLVGRFIKRQLLRYNLKVIEDKDNKKVQDILELLFVIDVLRTNNVILTGAKISYSLFLNFPGVKQQLDNFISIYTFISEEQGLIKIIQQANSDDFIKQLQDYAYRPALRKPRTEEAKCTHKYVHDKDEIVLYKSHKDRVKIHTCLKKQSLAFLSRNLDTVVYGEHDAVRVLLGLAFDQRQCLPPKAIFKHDYGTVKRKWVGTEAEVKKYAEKVKAVRLNNWDELRKHVRDKNNRGIMTEILGRVTREAARFIIIARDNKESRSLALNFQSRLQNININMPIVIYNRILQHITIFSERSFLKSAEARFELLKMRDVVEGSTQGFFSKASATSRLKDISALITAAKNVESQNPHIWQEKLLAAQNLSTTPSPQPALQINTSLRQA